MEKKKNYLLKESETFCMIPWIHLHTTPSGTVMPCCISKVPEKDFGDSKILPIKELINLDRMKTLRRNMIEGVKSYNCKQCYAHESQGIKSFRQSVNEEYEKYFDECWSNTDVDGGIRDFKMRYFDIRFSNICNFKCRTCDQEYSSQWEAENQKYHKPIAKIIPKNNSLELVEEVLSHIPYLEAAYFAGGEPLITEEHYIILEELIKQNRTNVRLVYNTNLSNFKFKNKDLISLWKNFKGVYVYASIDHYGEKAEYIRHGTDWGLVESNLNTIKKLDYVKTQLNTVCSIYNYLTFDDFYNYLLEKNLYSPKDYVNTIYNMQGPIQLTSQALPRKLKDEATKRMMNLIQAMKDIGFVGDKIEFLNNTISWAESQDQWEANKDLFQKETTRIDKIRGENFVEVFPELAELMD
jgi:organic radical activating enzyme